jgi:hypothetical protein
MFMHLLFVSSLGLHIQFSAYCCVFTPRTTPKQHTSPAAPAMYRFSALTGFTKDQALAFVASKHFS